MVSSECKRGLRNNMKEVPVQVNKVRVASVYIPFLVAKLDEKLQHTSDRITSHHITSHITLMRGQRTS